MAPNILRYLIAIESTLFQSKSKVLRYLPSSSIAFQISKAASVSIKHCSTVVYCCSGTGRMRY